MLTLNLNLGDLSGLEERLRIKADILLERGAADLAVQVHGHIVEQAARKLHSSRSQYIEALSYEQRERGEWVIKLNKSAMWIEEGMARHEMIDDLLRHGARVNPKTGVRYKAIPMAIKGKTSTPAAAQILRQAAMGAARAAGINMREVEREVDGRIREGLIHRLTVANHPLRTGIGAYQGHGAMGDPRQGMTGRSFLSGLQIRQKMIGGAGGMVQKTAMVFRVVSSLHKGTGRWVHPGFKAVKLFDEANQWATREWENKLMPEILAALFPQM